MPWLVCVKGEDKGATFELCEREMILGRSPQCDIQMVHSKISGKHCKVFLKGQRLVVSDLESSNGVKVNGKRIRGKSVSLSFDQQFALGEDVFSFVEQHVEANGENNGSSGKSVVREYTKEAISEAKQKRSKGLLSRFLGKKK